MTSRPLVSIGIPVYNGERFITDAINSVQNQTYTNLEIVISDNCSTDKTTEICLGYAAGDGRIRYSRNTTNIGLTQNILRVMKLATGDFFMLACADDIRPCNAVEVLVRTLLQNPQAVMAHGPVLAKSRDFQVEFTNKMELASPDPAKRVRTFTKEIGHNAMVYGLYRRTALRNSVFGDHFGQDYLMCLQMCMLGPIEYTATPMITYLQNGPSIDPMGDEVPLSVGSLVAFNRRAKKCWVVLGYGCLYLFRLRETKILQRMMAVLAYLLSFIARYGRRLRRDLVLLFLAPLSYSVTLAWNLARRFPPALRLGRSVKTLLKHG
jgi:glycosyltransferase involved in cell wall biosynthesis